MTFYLDASVVVAIVTDEPNSSVVTTWIENHKDSAAISLWTLTETASALSIKVRDHRMTVQDKIDAERQVEGMRNRFLLNAEINETHFYAARRYATFHEAGLRGGDALHVAIAADYDLTLGTMDKQMAKGARMLGVAVTFLPEGSVQ